jgi:hypothetical protein
VALRKLRIGERMPARRQLWTPGGGGQRVEQLGVVARAGPVGVEEWRCSAARPADCSAGGKLQWPGGGVGAGGRLGLVGAWNSSSGGTTHRRRAEVLACLDMELGERSGKEPVGFGIIVALDAWWPGSARAPPGGRCLASAPRRKEEGGRQVGPWQLKSRI